MFRHGNKESCALEAHNTAAWEEAPLGFAPKLTMEDLMSFERPDADKYALESALDALDDANFTMMYPMIRRLSKIQDNMQIDLNQFVIEDSIFKQKQNNQDVLLTEQSSAAERKHLSQHFSAPSFDHELDGGKASDLNISARWAPTDADKEV